MAETHFRTCHLCEAMCGVAIEHEAGDLRAVRGDDEDPFSRGHICPKAVSLLDLHHDPDRLTRPLVRKDGVLVETSWEEALDTAAAGLLRVRKQHGRHALALYQGNPTVHNYGAMLFGQLFARTLHTRHHFSATSVDQLPHMLAAYLMFGNQILLPIPDLDRTDYLLVVGANPAVSNGSLMTAGGAARRLKDIQRRGGKVIVLDPRRTETAKTADEHHFIRPGTDALFLAAFVWTLFEEDLARPAALNAYLSGMDTLRAAVAPYTPERVASATGIPAPEIRRLVRDFARATRAAAYGRVGVSTQPLGALSAWLLNAINVLTGNLDRPGGMMFPVPAVDLPGLAPRLGLRGSFGRFRSRVRKLPEFGGELPVSTLAEEIATPGERQIRALITSAGNPVLSTPNGRQLDRALASLDFMVSIDLYRNETTRHAHVILPPTFGIEHDHYDLAFHMLSVRNTAKYSPALVTRRADQRHDWEIFLDLFARLTSRAGLLGQLEQRAKSLLGRMLPPHRILDLALRVGPYGAGLLPLGRKGLSLSALRRAPHGVDLGPLTPVLPKRLSTKSRTIELAPAPMIDDLPRLAALLVEETPAGALSLIGRRELRSNNSWGHNSERMVRGKERCTLRIHPDDARARSLPNGALARVVSRVGEVLVPVEHSEDMMPGVVSLPHGWGHNREETKLSVASQRPGVSLNDLTDDARVDTLSGTAGFNGTPVTVTAAASA